MLNGMSLFTGYRGIDEALRGYVKPIIYCDIEPYAQGIIISRMDDRPEDFAPIWNDVTTLDGKKFRGLVDIVYGGSPCQNFSNAGNGQGLEGKQSGLLRHILRIAVEAESPFIFIENVPGIEGRGAEEIQKALADIGYSARWGHLSASEVGANHKRERWFCLAYKDYSKVPDSDVSRFRRQAASTEEEDNQGKWQGDGRPMSTPFNSDWWEVEPAIHRVDDGPVIKLDSFKSVGGKLIDPRTNEEAQSEEITKYFRQERVKACGNGVVPRQVRIAFEELMGIK